MQRTGAVGHVIILSGGSSAGKSSLAHVLQDTLNEPYLWLDPDVFRAFLPERLHIRVPPHQLAHGDPMRFIAGFHRTVAAFAIAGNNVLVDHTLYPPAWRDDCVTALACINPLFVGLRCPAEVANARERKRGDRPPGLAAFTADRCHDGATYDLELDSSAAGPEELSRLVITRIRESRTPSAFQLLLHRIGIGQR